MYMQPTCGALLHSYLSTRAPVRLKRCHVIFSTHIKNKLQQQEIGDRVDDCVLIGYRLTFAGATFAAGCC